LLGGSAAWGYGSSSNETSLSYKVEKYLKTEEKDLRKKIIFLKMDITAHKS